MAGTVDDCTEADIISSELHFSLFSAAQGVAVWTHLILWGSSGIHNLLRHRRDRGPASKLFLSCLILVR